MFEISQDFSGISHFLLIYGRCVGFGKVGFGIFDPVDLSSEALRPPTETALAPPSMSMTMSIQLGGSVGQTSISGVWANATRPNDYTT